jgi:hypothetical protein
MAPPVQASASIDWYRLLGVVVLLVAIGALWQTLAVYPLKILVVFFHELSHALACLLTGGHVQRIELSYNEGGLTYCLGGNAFLVTSAGYIGSLLWGGLILNLAGRMANCRPLTAILGGIMGVTCLLLIRPVIGFGFLFCALGAAGLLASARFLNHDANSLLLRCIGLTSLLYVPLDIVDDTILRSGQVSDARLLAQITFVPTIVWGLIWCALSLWLVWHFVLAAVRKPVREGLGSAVLAARVSEL